MIGLEGKWLGVALFLAVPFTGAAAASASPFAPLPVIDEEDDDEDEGAEKAEEEDSQAWFAVVGGDVYTGTGAVLRGATVLSKNGVIKEIGHAVVVPDDAEVLDATGYRIYPGLVAVQSSGLFGSASGDFGDSVDPFHRNLVLALAGGITTAGQSNTALKLKRGEIDGVVLREKFLTSQNFGTSNPNAKRSLREKLEAAARYMREYQQWEIDKKEDKEAPEPSKKGVDNSILSILRGENLARFSADDRGDLVAIARLAQQYGFRPVISSAQEGWTVASELGRAGAYAIVTPRDRSAKNEQLLRDGGTSIENAAILHRHGVQVAVVPSGTSISLMGIVGRDIMHLTVEAGFAVRGGLSEQAALEAITIVPARILGVSHRVGSLEVGKDCDLIVTDGDILHYQTFVQWAVVEGDVVYDKEEELFFAHIRPRPESEASAEETHLDPGEAEDPEGGADPGEEGDDDEGEETAEEG